MRVRDLADDFLKLLCILNKKTQKMHSNKSIYRLSFRDWTKIESYSINLGFPVNEKSSISNAFETFPLSFCNYQFKEIW